MKKYLMTGVAALAICAAFTSCSKSEELFDQGVVDGQIKESVNEQYAAAFEKAFGKVGPNVDWGFGSGAGTRGATPNANQWAQKYLVPDPLTAGQIERVTRYFQSHPNLDYVDPGWSNYFMQQVYKGGYTDRNNSTWCTSEKKEWYTSANNGTVIGSDHMDHLIAKSSTGATDHIFNFNNGNCSENHNVGDNGAALDTKQHTDRIQLMENSYTYTFTYGSSDASMVRERRCALVAASVIDEWGDANGVGSKVDDKWHRSFMGFDFEQRVSDEIFEKDQSSADGFKYATIGDAPNGKSLVWDGTQVRNYNDIKNELLTDFDGNPVRMLINETNMYCGTNGDVDQNDLYTTKNLKNPETGHYQDYDVLDLTILRQKIADGYYPVESSTLCKWVKPEGGADGYYSDWIVTLSEAQPVNNPTTPTYRVIAEDLNAGEKTDFDFNDVVFDVEPNEAGTAARLVLQACGGIYKLTVADVEVHGLYNYGPDEKGLYPMINTHDGPSDLGPRTIVESYVGNFSTDAEIRATIKAIPIVVWKPKANDPKDTLPYTIDAKTGEPAAKVLVDKTFNIVPEHHSIADENNQFTNYVQGRFEGDFWWKY